ncbi:hypothetical protein BD626DRAFT_472925 [Schizophyllum amplum]|uniref:DUF221-domain-containing protein n=1 Tax=Schizophyllum amplum TaxID=97359 RepID=A0A550CWD4_9AGAR|nr:hypothetical protein BD626DRAFT_472925 [Auriculariopsis ampla]
MGAIDDAGDLINNDSRTLAPEAVASQVALMSVISVITVLAFNILRPKNKIIYEPKVKYHVGNKPPPRISSGLFGWLPPLVHTKEPELMDKVGLDAVTFLRFLRMMRWLFTGIAVLTCGILIPINVWYNIKNDVDGRDILSMLTIRDVSGNILFAHVAVTYLVTFLIMWCVYVHWREMVKLRHAWFHSEEYQQAFYARTLAVRNVPKKLQTDEGLKAIFESVKVPYPTTSVHIGRKVGKLPELIELHNDTVRQLEEYLVRYLKGGKMGKKRPTIRIGAFMGMGGKKLDAIDYYTDKLRRMEGAIQEYRRQIDTRKAENYGFASMAAVPYAHVVAKILEDKHPKGTDIELAPNPKDIVWTNMNMTDGERARKQTIGSLILVVVCFFNTVPLFIISILANLSSLTTWVPFLANWQGESESSFNFVSGVLPPAVSAAFGFVLPIIMRKLTSYMGALTHSRLDRAVVARYFAFLVISQLVVFTLIGVIFNCVKEIIRQVGKKSFSEIIHNLDTLPDTINRTYIDQSSYWLTYFPLRGFLVLFDLAQVVNLLWLSFKTHVFGRTPRDIREWTQPPEFQYAIYYSNTLFMGAVALVFAPLAPLVALAAAIVFWMSSIVQKYQLMFVFVSKVESGGRLWNVVINRLLFTVLLMQAMMTLTIGLQTGWSTFEWCSTLPPVLFIIIFKLYLNHTFVHKFKHYTPTQDELRLAKVHSERADLKGNRLEKRFGHPALHTELFTPMLHKNMMPLLGQVYGGKMAHQDVKMDEYGGKKMEAQVVQGGIRIAAIDQAQLEYDPALYQRDRGELDWDAKSMTSTAILDAPSMYNYNMDGQGSVGQMRYQNYLAQGPSQSEIELNHMDSPHEPLLNPRAQFVQAPSMAAYGSSQSLTPPSLYQEPMAAHSTSGFREAPLHRQMSYDTTYSPEQAMEYPPRPTHMQYPSNYSQGSDYGAPPPQQNMAGRGAGRFQ